MLLKEILSLLDSSTIKVKKNDLDENRYSGVILLGGSMSLTLSDRHAALFSPVSYFNTLPESFIRGNAFFLYADEPAKPTSGPTSLILMEHRVDWLGAFETIAHEFRILQRKKDRILNLTSMVSGGASFKRLVNEAASIVGAPASALDNSLSFLAYSDDFPEYTLHGAEEPTNMLPDSAVRLLKAKGLVNPRESSDLVVFDWVDGDGCTQTNHLSFIHSGDDVIGSISFFTKNGRLRPSRAEMIPTIAQILGMEMQKSSTYLLNKSLYYAYLFKQLSEGALPRDPEQLERKFSLFGYELRQHLHIFVVDFSDAYLSPKQVQPLAERLHPFISNSIYIVNPTNLIFLSSENRRSESGVCDFEGLEEALRGTAVKVGVSSIYQKTERTPFYIDEAHRAIKVGAALAPTKRVFPFARYRLLDLVSNVIDPVLLQSYLYPPLMEVIEEDERHGTHLAFTLYCYLLDPAHPQKVAEDLFIHKNTLYYRLSRVKEIMGREIDDAETVTSLFMSFLVLRYQDRFDKLVLRGKVEPQERKPED